LQAYEQACKRRRLTPLSGLGGATREAMSATAMSMLDRHPEVTAFVAPQEASVAGVLRAVEARGLRIPDDMSLVAIAGDAASELATPPLTTIAFPADELGTAAARMLLERLTHGRSAQENTLVRPKLTIRGTTAPPMVASTTR
jgi:DNA-binding LacI/PurR family transcriptional regulator